MSFFLRPFKQFAPACIAIVLMWVCGSAARAAQSLQVQQWNDSIDSQILDYYQDPTAFNHAPINLDAVVANWNPVARHIALLPSPFSSFPFEVGWARGRLQQAIVLEMNNAVLQGRLEDAKAFRAELNLPRGVSATEGALILQSLGPDKRVEAARLLVREAITWQTARTRQLLAEMESYAAHSDVPMPGRLMERLGEVAALADFTPPLRDAAGLTGPALLNTADLQSNLEEIEKSDWSHATLPVSAFREKIETHLPSLLSEKERQRRERLLLKLVTIIPREYSSGVRDGQITVPLEYREAVSFTAQAREFADELAPLWLAENSRRFAPALAELEAKLNDAAHAIDTKQSPDQLASTLKETAGILEKTFNISLHRNGTTADIVDEVMLETRSLLSQSLTAANQEKWDDAANLRLEAYTSYDPELEARLMPRDPQLATDIEHLLLDGLDQPGVKVLLDRHVNGSELEAAYARVYSALDHASAILKSDISPTAAALSAGSIVAREGLEGLLVAVAILAGLRGDENAQRRRLFWMGIAASVAATAITWLLSQTLITSLRAYGEVIEAVTGILAIVVLLLITNWLFHQVYWRQWVTALKNQAAGESAWQLLTVGFLVGYREGFETVLFLQSLILDGSGKAVAAGVAVGCLLLLILGVAVLKVGLKLPYYRILLLTAVMIGFVLITFVGGTARSAQTIGWLPVHRLTGGSWPNALGSWLGIHNTVESVLAQLCAVLLVLVTWRVSRWRAHRKANKRRQLHCAVTTCQRSLVDCCQVTGEKPEMELVELQVPQTV